LLLAGGCDREKPARTVINSENPPLINTDNKPVASPTDYVPGQAWQAYYPPGISKARPSATHLKNQFAIIADTSFVAQNFVSFSESNLRRWAAHADSTYLLRGEAWRKLTSQQKQTEVARWRAACGRQADSLHTVNNRGHLQIWLFNNSADTVHLATQDDSFICVLQAQDKKQRWCSVQYWEFSKCGNSYYNQLLSPGEQVSLLTTLPNRGHDKIKLRYKLAGTSQFYYSNEFESRVNYHEFIENNPCRKWAVAGKQSPARLLGRLPPGSKSYFQTATLAQLLRD
jgi:hypothetical protein